MAKTKKQKVTVNKKAEDIATGTLVCACGFDKDTYEKHKNEFSALIDSCFEAGRAWEKSM